MSKDKESPFSNNNQIQEQERRQLLRVEDTAIVELSPASNVVAFSEDNEAPMSEQLLALEKAANEEGRLFYLMRELQSIDQHCGNAFRVLRDQSPELGQCLEAINQKLNFIGEALSDNLFDGEAEFQTIDLSAAGIGFNHPERLAENSTHRLKLWFDQTRVGVCATIRVVACNRAINGGYHISALFSSIADSDRQIISKHIMQIEASMRREAATLKAAMDNES